MFSHVGTFFVKNIYKIYAFGRFYLIQQVVDFLFGSKYFIYLTDGEMATYFQNPANGFAELFSLKVGKAFTIDEKLILSRPRTFQDVVRLVKVDCKAVGAFQADLWFDHFLRIFELQT